MLLKALQRAEAVLSRVRKLNRPRTLFARKQVVDTKDNAFRVRVAGPYGLKIRHLAYLLYRQRDTWLAGSVQSAAYRIGILRIVRWSRAH
jgi:hypothetical protein